MVTLRSNNLVQVAVEQQADGAGLRQAQHERTGMFNAETSRSAHDFGNGISHERFEGFLVHSNVVNNAASLSAQIELTTVQAEPVEARPEFVEEAWRIS